MVTKQFQFNIFQHLYIVMFNTIKDMLQFIAHIPLLKPLLWCAPIQPFKSQLRLVYWNLNNSSLENYKYIHQSETESQDGIYPV